MQIGPYQISTIETGYVSLDGGAMFGVVPKPLWSKSNPADDKNRIILAMRSLVIRWNGRVMITDTGVGKKMNEKLSRIYNVDHEKYDLLSSLEKAGLKPEEISDVFLTHLHFDHTGGTTRLDEKDELQLTFSNATHHIQKEHWQWANNPSVRDGASFMKENFVPVKEHGKLNLIDGPGTFEPGMEIFVLQGHTPSMQTLKISDGKKTLFYCADLMPTATHIPLPYIMGYDLQPMSTLEEKKNVLPQAVDEEWLLVFEHDPYHVAGKVEKTEKGYSLGEEIKDI